MTPQEWDEWQEFANLEPFGPLQEELRAAILAIYMAAPYREQNSRPLHPGDIFPSLKAEPEEENPEEERTRIISMFVALGMEMPE